MPLRSDRSQLLKLARAGAETRLAELRQEIQFIYRSFPDMRRSGRAAASPAAAARVGRSRRRRPGARGWSVAQRKAAADRMKKYWAARKAGKK